jgi:predicted RNase H-like HicB family nuclease
MAQSSMIIIYTAHPSERIRNNVQCAKSSPTHSYDMPTKEEESEERGIDLREIGISEEEAAELRAKFETFEDWNDPAMDIYNDYDSSRSGLLEGEKPVDKRMTEVTLTAMYEEAEEGGYIGYIAELPGANTQGETVEEVRENLLEAMEMILEAKLERVRDAG